MMDEEHAVFDFHAPAVALPGLIQDLQKHMPLNVTVELQIIEVRE
jgi:hypothetical protein